MTTSDNTPSPNSHPEAAHHEGPLEDMPASRRVFLLAGVATLLAGCSAPRSASTMPGPVWRPRPSEPSPPYYTGDPTPLPPVSTPSMPGVLSRSQWTTARPLQTRLTTMTPINYITVHHDGMSPFYDADQSSSAARLESIRRSHRDGNRWADIGYHFAIDRSGRVWECRSLAYQGAHVGNHNEGNIGVLVMGNFDQQTPSSRQLDALNAHLSHLMRIHRVPLTRVATHREWETARTACPGSTLQSHMDLARRRGWLG